MAEAMLVRAKRAPRDGAAKKRRAQKMTARIRAKTQADLTDSTLQLSQKLERLTGLEARVTILGYLRRGGTPSAGDRLKDECFEVVGQFWPGTATDTT